MEASEWQKGPGSEEATSPEPVLSPLSSSSLLGGGILVQLNFNPPPAIAPFDLPTAPLCLRYKLPLTTDLWPSYPTQGILNLGLTIRRMGKYLTLYQWLRIVPYPPCISHGWEDQCSLHSTQLCEPDDKCYSFSWSYVRKQLIFHIIICCWHHSGVVNGSADDNTVTGGWCTVWFDKNVTGFWSAVKVQCRIALISQQQLTCRD